MMPSLSLTLPMVLALGLIAGALWVLLVLGFHLLTRDNRVNTEEVLTSQRKKADDEVFILYRITGMIGRPFRATVLNLLGEDGQRAVRRRISSAGHPDGITVEDYAQRKAGEIMLFGGLTVMLFLGGSYFWGILTLLFAGMTDLHLLTSSRQRQDQIQQQLPDFLDVLAVTVGAGLSFRQALERVADAMPGVLADEFRIALRQMDLGTSRKNAFLALQDRNSNESLGKFVTAIQQSEELGAPLSSALSEISQDMRRDDAQYMRRKAQKLNPQVTGISAATLLPALILLLGGAMWFGMAPDLGNLGL